ncbi:MAG: hypothetical protein IJ367_00610, partial [Clostridia bacterium]|nr:hypothetical protein [Clostridia bacterium]
DRTNLLCQEVTVLADEPLYGVIGAIPPHLTKTGEEAKKEELLIDTGLKNARERIPRGLP